MRSVAQSLKGIRETKPGSGTFDAFLFGQRRDGMTKAGAALKYQHHVSPGWALFAQSVASYESGAGWGASGQVGVSGKW